MIHNTRTVKLNKILLRIKGSAILDHLATVMKTLVKKYIAIFLLSSLSVDKMMDIKGNASVFCLHVCVTDIV